MARKITWGQIHFYSHFYYILFIFLFAANRDEILYHRRYIESLWNMVSDIEWFKYNPQASSQATHHLQFDDFLTFHIILQHFTTERKLYLFLTNFSLFSSHSTIFILKWVCMYVPRFTFSYIFCSWYILSTQNNLRTNIITI